MSVLLWLHPAVSLSVLLTHKGFISCWETLPSGFLTAQEGYREYIFMCLKFSIGSLFYHLVPSTLLPCSQHSAGIPIPVTSFAKERNFSLDWPVLLGHRWWRVLLPPKGLCYLCPPQSPAGCPDSPVAKTWLLLLPACFCSLLLSFPWKYSFFQKM